MSRSPGSHEGDEPGRFKLLASAIAGCSVEVASTDRGEPAWTDGATVFIDVHADASRRLASLAVQSALLGAGSLQGEVLAALVRRSGLVSRYLAIEGHRALRAHEHLLPPAARGLIDRQLAGRTHSPAESLSIAGSREDVREPPETFGTIWPKRIRASADRGEDPDAVQHHAPRRNDKTQLNELDDQDDDPGGSAALLSSPVGGEGGIGRLLNKLFGRARSPESGPPGADSPTHRSRRGARLARIVALSTARASIPEDVAVGERQGVTYPEWDMHKRRYRPDWCTVYEVDPAPSGLAPFVPPNTQQLRRPLARLGIELEHHRRQLQGDDIDIDAAVEAVVALKAGSAPDEAVYVDTLRRRRDLSVLLLLDVSGSAGEPSATGDPVHEHQRAAAAALAVALNDLGDRLGLYVFRSQGRSAVYVLPLKRFDEDLDARVMDRLGGLVPGAYTRLGAAIRHGAAVLEDAGTSRRLLVVLSDGLAYDHRYERAYGEADARRALAETRRRGIGCLCLSIGAGRDPSELRRVFGTAAHAAIPRVEQLPMVVGPLFRSALLSAEHRRKMSQRKERAKVRLSIERRTA